MKKKRITILFFAILCCFFVSCSVNSSSENVSTTAVTDNEGSTHFYETVTDENGEDVTAQNGEKVFAEIETNNDGTAVTNSNGTFVTINETTVFSNQNTSSNANGHSSSGGSSDDNEVAFETDLEEGTTSENPAKNTTTTEPTTVHAGDTTTQSATDADGWINKWY